MDNQPKRKSKEYKFKKSEDENNRKRLIVILEFASLETVKSKRTEGGYELLNCDDHIHILKKLNRDWTEARPDITHQVKQIINLNFMHWSRC